MPNYRRTLTLCAAALLLAGCGRGSQPADKEFDEATPDMSALGLEVTGSAAEEGLSSAALEAEDGVGQRTDPVCSGTPACAARPEFCTAVPNFLLDARAYVKDLNLGVRKVLSPIAEIIKNNPSTQTGTSHVWPTKDVGNLTFRFAMKKAKEKTFGWKLDAKAKGSDDSTYQTVMGGVLVRGLLPHRGAGAMGVDLDKVKALDSSFTGQGKLLMGFKHVGDPAVSTLAYALKQFTVDSTLRNPVSGMFHGVKLPSGERRVRLVGNADVRCSATSAKELVLLRSRWIPGVGGRADGLAVGGVGDVAAGRVYVGNACWGTDFAQGFFLLRDCAKGAITPGQCTVLQSEGALTSCGTGLSTEEVPAEDPNDTSPETGGEAVIVPADIPSGEGT